jgi:hypothetical protein
VQMSDVYRPLVAALQVALGAGRGVTATHSDLHWDPSWERIQG